MPLFKLNSEPVFPSPELATESGLLAIGGDLSPERVLTAYQMGIFPWFNPNELPQWWSPDPRFVLFPERIKIAKSMRPILRKPKFTVTFDQAFQQVIRECQAIFRPGQFGTWITDEMIETYEILHQMGFIHSVEVWEDNELVGGLYGGCIGKCFFGESMFSHASNASKAGFLTLVRNLQIHRFELIDCQVYTPHLETLGAEMISRSDFLKILKRNHQEQFEKEDWNETFETYFAKW